MAPLSTTPGGNPVTELPGLSPRFPVMIVAPVLVTVEPPKMAKFSAAPSGTVWAAVVQEIASSAETVNAPAHAAADLRICFLCVELFCMRHMPAARVLHLDAVSSCFYRGKLLRDCDEQATQTRSPLSHSWEKPCDPPALSEPDKGKSHNAREPSTWFRNIRNSDSIGIQRDGCIDRDESPDDSGPAVNGDALVGQDISVKNAVDVNGG